MTTADFGRNLRPWPGLILLALCLVIGLCTYQNYGVSWDEGVQRTIGMTSYNFVFESDTSLKTYVERDHGVGFELPLIFIEKAMGLTDMRDIYLMRHLASHLFFLIGMYAGYVLALRIFRNQWLALLCFLLLVFYPRIYAHSFYNSKDVPFLAVVTVCMMLAEAAFRRRRWWLHLLLGMACGYATSIRILGITPSAIILLFYGIDLLSGGKSSWKTILRHAVIFSCSLCLALYVSWPTLWGNPIHNFAEAYASLSKFRWESWVFLHGHTFFSLALPWYYIPLWFCITMPELWLLAGLAGMVITLTAFVRRPLTLLANTPQRNFLLYGLLILIPVASVIVLKAVVYDEWRHLYFIYPPFVFFAVAGLQQAARINKTVKTVITCLCIAQLVDTAVFMIHNHPNTVVYFNRMVWHGDEYLRHRYELDYWGASFKQGYEQIIARDPSYDIKVMGEGGPFYNNYDMLPATDRIRIKLTHNDAEANYFITNFRNHAYDYPQYGKVFYEIKVQGSTIMRVYKLK